MSIKGIPFIGKVKEKLWEPLYVTVQKMGSSRSALDVVAKKYYLLNPVPTTPYSAEAGSDDNLLVVTGHSFKEGDLVRFLSTVNNINEFEVVIDKIIDANTVKLAGYLSADLTIGDTFDVLRPVAERVASDGSSLSTVISPPIQYNRKSAGVTAATTVLEDLDTPTNSRGLPVVIRSIDGAPIIVNAGDLSVSTSHVNDSMALGDGTNLVGVTANNELKSRDADLNTNIGAQADVVASTDTGTFSLIALVKRLNQLISAMTLKFTDGTQLTKITDGAGTVTTKQLGTAVTNTDVGLVTNTVIHGLSSGGGGSYVDVKVTPSGALVADITSNGANIATETTLSAQNTLIGAVTETAPASDTASSGLNGRLQRIAQRLSSLIALLPASLGQKTSAASLAVVIASDNTVATTDAATSSLDTNLGAKADAVATTDTGTFSLIALVKKLNQSLTAMIAQLPASLGAKTSANSFSVVPASDAIFNTKPKAITNSFDENLSLTTAGSTFTAPANAIGFKIMADDTNSANVRYKAGATASTTSGMQLQAGRAEDHQGGSNVSIFAESDTQKVMIQWAIQA